MSLMTNPWQPVIDRLKYLSPRGTCVDYCGDCPLPTLILWGDVCPEARWCIEVLECAARDDTSLASLLEDRRRAALELDIEEL